ncbi:hypothetical protein OG339_42125 [Streptosporangium sp. NBC_01495]|uniref:hypothetical protein n=1 Tax=Streptosporangium sp. NBC_01495 TaxID=2903899 RepID=UPI002E31B53E|nr:hypothetical protein [Streptosporangium sp. NBC_01495]
MRLKNIGNALFIVCTLALAGWAVASPDSVPKPVLAGGIVLCVMVLVVLFATNRRKRPQ